MIKSYFILVTLLFVSGCFTVETASMEKFVGSELSNTDPKRVEHIVVNNYGWYLFNRFPLACGNTDAFAEGTSVFFTDEVTSEKVHGSLMTYADANHFDVSDLEMSVNESVFFELPSTSIPIPIPYVICYREIGCSAVLTRRSNLVPHARRGAK